MSGAISDLYRTLAQGCFVLIGLWFVVVQNKREDWRPDPARRRQAWHITLLFLLPATMSLIALLAPESSAYWRVPFAIGGFLGAAETLRTLLRATDLQRQLTLVATGVLYLAIGLLAVFPGLPGDVGIGVRALVLEGTLAALAVFLTVGLAWQLFTEDWETSPRLGGDGSSSASPVLPMTPDPAEGVSGVREGGDTP